MHKKWHTKNVALVLCVHTTISFQKFFLISTQKWNMVLSYQVFNHDIILPFLKPSKGFKLSSKILRFGRVYGFWRVLVCRDAFFCRSPPKPSRGTGRWSLFTWYSNAAATPTACLSIACQPQARNA